MRAKAALSLLLLGSLTALLLFPSGPAAAKKRRAKTVTVGKDATGDWGENAGAPGLAPLGAALGQDLVSASVGMGKKKTVNFIIKVTSLPPVGGTPEVTRYNWDFTVNGKGLELDGKFSNYTRGACDPTSGQCPPPRDPGSAPFFIRGNCETVGTTVVCEELGIVHAKFNAAKGTITIPVPMKLIKAKSGSKIAGGVSDFGGSVAAAASAFVTPFAAPNDTLTVTKTFRIP
jgi:hypothetical protein